MKASYFWNVKIWIFSFCWKTLKTRKQLRQLSALLMPRLELPLIILMTWICFHFRKVNRYTCRNYPKTSQNSQNVFNSKYLNFHSSSNIVIENKNVNKSKSSWWWVATRDEASIRHIIGTMLILTLLKFLFDYKFHQFFIMLYQSCFKIRSFQKKVPNQLLTCL